MKIKFCGAAGTVTGSCHLLTFDDGFTVLLDCGLFQGDDDDVDTLNRRWGFDPKEIDVVILSHAHIDHCGRLPRLVRDGFRGKIYCTYATRDLATLMLYDSANIQEQDAEYLSKKMQKHVQPLYRSEDVLYMLHYLRGCKYDRWYILKEDFSIKFLDAGHILGSASVTIEYKDKNGTLKRFGFTGDIGRPDRPILKDPIPIPEVNYLISESTYGGKQHLDNPTEFEKLRRVIYETCVERRGKLIIPAFSVGRTQELVYKLHLLNLEGRLPNVQIYVDSPMAVSATDIYREHPECFDEETFQILQHTDDPFGFEKVIFIRNIEESKSLNNNDGPCIIISASGMASSGRIRHHIFNNIEKRENTILIVGYCSPGTLGAKLAEIPETVRIFGEVLPVNANIEQLHSMSAHGDEEEMMDFLSNQNPETLHQIFLVHGEDKARKLYKERLLYAGFKDVVVPKYGQEMELD